MPKRKQTCSEGRQQPGRQTSKKSKQHTAPVRHQCCEPNSDESHRTEQLLHRGSVTPPRRQPVRTRRTKQTRTSRHVVRNTLQPSETCLTLSNSEEESDILHYNPDTALYYPGTDLVIDGWFQPCRWAHNLLPSTLYNLLAAQAQGSSSCNTSEVCRGCGAFTAGRLLADHKEAPVCQRCGVTA